MNLLTRWSFWATIFSLTLLPPLQVTPSAPAVQLDDIVPLVWLVAAALFLDWRLSPAIQTRALLFVLFAAVIPISVANGIANGFAGGYADLNQIIRILKYLAVYLLASVYFSQSTTPVWRIAWFAVPLFAICLSQYLNPFDINELYVRQIAPTQFVTLVDNYPEPRPIGMVGNPNDAGFLFAMLCLTGLYGALRNRSVIAAILATVAALGLLMTLSRTAMVALAVGAVLMILLHQYSEGKFRSALKWIALILLAALPILALPPIYTTITMRIATILDYSNQASWLARVENWRENIVLGLQHPIWGVGPLRRVVFEHAADNDWLLIFRSYGLIGVSIVLAIFFLPTAFLKSKALSLAVLAAVCINMILATVFFSLVLLPFALVILAYSDSHADA